MLYGMKVVEKRISKINGKIVVVKSFGFGNYIQVSGLTQSGGIVRGIWRQTLKKAKKLRPEIKNCLILGLGGGTAAKIIKKSWSEAKITGIELDPVMIELGKKYLGLAVDNIYIGDAERAIKRTKEKYDLVIVDCYLGDKFPERFESPEFLKMVFKLLSKKGLVIFNRLYYGDKRPAAVKFGEKLKKVFTDVEYFYPEANLMFICKT